MSEAGAGEIGQSKYCEDLEPEGADIQLDWPKEILAEIETA